MSGGGLGASQRALITAALVAVGLGGLAGRAHANPPGPWADGPAVELSPEQIAATEAEAALVRQIKKAEREGFEQHDATRYFEPFAPDAVWIEARREVPDAHDVRIERKQKEQMVERRFRAPLTGKEQLFMRDVESKIEADRAVLSATLRRVHFGGQDAVRHRYVLRRGAAGWQITEVRRWPVQEAMQGLMQIYDDSRWAQLDEQADRALAGSEEKPISRLTDLIKARRMAQAYALARTTTEQQPDDAAAWRARADMAFELGRIEEAVSAGRRATQLSPGEPLPVHLR